MRRKKRRIRRPRKNLALVCLKGKIKKAGLTVGQVRWWVSDESRFPDESQLYTAQIMTLRLEGQSLAKIALHYGTTKSAIHARERRFFALSRFRILTEWRRYQQLRGDT